MAKSIQNDKRIFLTRHESFDMKQHINQYGEAMRDIFL